MTNIFQKITITYHSVPVLAISKAGYINIGCDFQNSQSYQLKPEKQYRAFIKKCDRSSAKTEEKKSTWTLQNWIRRVLSGKMLPRDSKNRISLLQWLIYIRRT